MGIGKHSSHGYTYLATGTEALRKWVANGRSQILTFMWICTDEQGDESRTITAAMD